MTHRLMRLPAGFDSALLGKPLKHLPDRELASMPAYFAKSSIEEISI